MKKTIVLFGILLSIQFQSLAQINGMETLDINNVKATILTRGDMFWNPDSAKAAYEFPKGSGLHSNFATSLWVSGYDASNGVLHVAAQTYRQTGNDYWPGPLDSSGNSTLSTATDWDKIWKVNRSTIDSFLLLPSHTLLNTPAVILEWPAKENSHAVGKNGAVLTITRDMAPYVDVNSDGIYNALDGDYPDIKGEQALWWVFNDKTPSHSESGGNALGFECKVMAYACNSIGSLQNTTFYNMKLTNKSANKYIQTRVGIYDDLDVGDAFDDFIGIDTTRSLAFGYNRQALDDNYGSMLTQTGLVILKLKQNGITVNNPFESFMFFNNENGPLGNPIIDTHYANYQRSKWLDGQSLTNTCNGRDAGNSIGYAYWGDPLNSGELSEASCNNVAYDRRFVLSTKDLNFDIGSSIEIQYAFINTPIGTPFQNISVLQSLADSAKLYASGCGAPEAPAFLNEADHANSFNVRVSPNPTHDELNISWQNSMESEVNEVVIVNSLGVKVVSYSITKQSNLNINLKHLAQGIYFAQVKGKNGKAIQRFVKQ